MQVFSVTVERNITRHIRVLADTPATAQALVNQIKPHGSTVTGAKAVHDESLLGPAQEGLGREALDHILSRSFLPLPEEPATWVQHWVRLAASPDGQERGNRALAMAGLRVGRQDATPCLFVASALSHPQLSEWCKGTPFAGAALLPHLATLRGATRPKSGLTFSGIGSRVVAIPLSTVFESVTP